MDVIVYTLPSTDCGPVPNITNGNVNAINTTYGATGNVQCDDGYKASQRDITCMANGTWSSASCNPLGETTV